MPEPNQSNNAENNTPNQQNTIVGSPANNYVTNEIGKRIVKYTLLSSSDLLALTILNTFSALFFSIAAFFYGNIYLSIQIQSLFSTTIPDSQKEQIIALQSYAKILIFICCSIGCLLLVFRWLLLRIARIESLDQNKKVGFFRIFSGKN